MDDGRVARVIYVAHIGNFKDATYIRVTYFDRSTVEIDLKFIR